MRTNMKTLSRLPVFFVLGFACSLDLSAQLWKRHVFSFQNSPDSVTCVYKAKTNELILSGFDTDGKGTFYFLGGSPLTVTCYEQGKLAYRRPLGIRFSGMVSFRLIGDSLYLIHREDHAMYRMYRDNKGAVDCIPLKTPPFERCFIGPIDAEPSFKLSNVKNSTTSISRIYDFHQKLLREYSYRTGNGWQQYDSVYQHVPDYWEYFGRYKGYRVCMKDYATIVLVDDSGEIVRQTGRTYEELDCWYVLNSRSDTIENWGATAEVRVLRNNHFYMPTFNAKKELVVWDVNVDALWKDY